MRQCGFEFDRIFIIFAPNSGNRCHAISGIISPQKSSKDRQDDAQLQALCALVISATVLIFIVIVQKNRAKKHFLKKSRKLRKIREISALCGYFTIIPESTSSSKSTKFHGSTTASV